MTAVGVPTAILRQAEELPFVDLGDGSTLQLLQVDVDAGLWVIRTIFSPGMTVDTHKHTGTVNAFTMSGSWLYLEYPDAINVAGSYLFEPAGSIDTPSALEYRSLSRNAAITSAWRLSAQNPRSSLR